VLKEKKITVIILNLNTFQNINQQQVTYFNRKWWFINIFVTKYTLRNAAAWTKHEAYLV